MNGWTVQIFLLYDPVERALETRRSLYPNHGREQLAVLPGQEETGYLSIIDLHLWRPL